MQKLTGNQIPKALREIPQPPEQLYCIGTLPEPHFVFLTVVGSRNHTTYAKDACRMLIESLRGYPVVIVSGLASGIDTIAHQTALATGLKTVAFPGSGLDPRVLTPRTNLMLAEEIVTSGGCLISEYEPLLPAQEWTFPKRNRLMAGISKATLIIEAKKKSGTLITAKLAGEYNRDVLALPGPITSPHAEGANFLLRQGATPITKCDDLLEALGFSTDHAEEPNQARLDALIDCSPEEKLLLEHLTEPLERDELYRQISKPAHEINMLITVLELKGLIKEEYGELRRI